MHITVESSECAVEGEAEFIHLPFIDDCREWLLNDDRPAAVIWFFVMGSTLIV